MNRRGRLDEREDHIPGRKPETEKDIINRKEIGRLR